MLVAEDMQSPECEGSQQAVGADHADEVAESDSDDADLAHVQEALPGSDQGPNQLAEGVGPGPSGLQLLDPVIRAEASPVHAGRDLPQLALPADRVAVLGEGVPEGRLVLVHEGGGHLTGGVSRDLEAGPSPQVIPISGKAVALSAGGDVIAPSRSAPVHRQLGDAILRMQGDVVELALSPEELGRVRIMIARSPDGLVISLLADRVQTLELLRENSTALYQDLMDAGEDGVQISFGDAGQGGAADAEGRDGRPGLARDEGIALLSEAQADAAGLILAGRLDIRM